MSDLPDDLSNLGSIPGGVVLAALQALEEAADDYEQQGYIRLQSDETVGGRFAILIRHELLPMLREMLAADPSEPIGALG